MASSTTNARQTLRATLGVDPETLVDVASLEACIARLNEQIEQVKATVYETANRHYNEFTSTFTYTMDLNNKVVELSSALETLSDRIEDPEHGIKAKLVNPARDYRQLKQQLMATDAIIVVLRQLTRIHDLLQEFDSVLDMGEYQTAASSLREISSILRELPRNKENGVDISITKVIKAEYVHKKSTFKHRLDELFSKAIVIKTTPLESDITVLSRLTGTMATQHFDNPTSISDLLGAMETFGVLGAKAATLLARCADLFVNPMLQQSGLALSNKTVPKTSTTFALQRPKESFATPHRALSELTSGQVYKDVLQFLQFIDSYVFPKPFAKSLFPPWWATISDGVIAHVLQPSIPDDESGLISFADTLGQSTIEFETEIIKLGFSTEEDRRLTKWTRNIHVHFWAKRRAAALSMARDLLATADHNSVQVTDATERGGLTALSEEKIKTSEEDSKSKPNKEGLETTQGLFRLPTMHISVRTQSLIELVYQTLNEASKVQPLGAVQLYYSARDMLDLFRAVIPVYHANEIDNVPQLAILFINDCNYIAHHLLTLGYQYQSQLPSPLKETATFVDMVPLFRRLADQQYLHQMTKQREQIFEFVASAEGFGDTHEDKRYETVERALKQCIHLLTHLSKVWMPIMPASFYFSSMGTLVDVLLESVCNGIQALKDIGEEETHQLHQLCQFVQRQSAPVSRHCPHWDRLILLDRLLIMSLVDIEASYESGNLKLLTRPELHALIKALFGETPKREALLKKLQD